jgi:hypothetical protein
MRILGMDVGVKRNNVIGGDKVRQGGNSALGDYGRDYGGNNTESNNDYRNNYVNNNIIKYN